jgi:hypothetical protein
MRIFSPYFPCMSWRWRRKSEESLVSRLESYYRQVVMRRGNRKKNVLVNVVEIDEKTEKSCSCSWFSFSISRPLNPSTS